MTFRQPPARVLIGDVHLTIHRASKSNTTLSFNSDIGFTVLIGKEWPHDKTGVTGELQVNSFFRLMAGKRLYLKEEKGARKLPFATPNAQDSVIRKVSGKKWRKALPFKEFPSSLPVAKLISSDIEVSISLNGPLSKDVKAAQDVVQEVRTQVPPEMFDLSKIVCGTYVDSRLLVLRGVNGSALFLTRTCINENCI